MASSSSSPDLSRRANEAFIDDNFELAVDLYNQAIALDSSSAELFADRAQANIKLANFTEAVADANRAIELDSSMTKAYFRKGVACLKLEEYQTAKAALELGRSLVPGGTRFHELIAECEKLLAEEAGSLSKSVTSGASTNSVSPLVASHPSNVPFQEIKDLESATQEPLQVTSVVKPKYRHDYYNSAEEVVLTIFAKGIPEKCVVVDFGGQTLRVSIDVPGEEKYDYQLRLFGKIVPEKCRYQVLPLKIEIRLAKANLISWTSLESNTTSSVQPKINVQQVGPKLGYPSSKAKTDWDKLEAEVKKEEKDEKLEGDAALNKMFRDIYQDADDDTRRAMSKSFLESKGTVLSTNWKEVGKKTVECTPPDGMEPKKWEY